MKQSIAWTIAALLTLTATTGAEAASYAKVSGWRQGTDKVALFRRDGAPLPPQPRPEIKDGEHEWLPDLDLVRLSENSEIWVQSKHLDLTFCEKSAERAMQAPSASGMKAATSFGSGERCEDVK